jgi:6-O-methylguanine DNA methyltransferase, DNA binding domain
MKASTLPQNPWTAKLDTKKLPKQVRLDKDFAGIKAGSMLFVGTPQIINDYVRKVPPGETCTIERMRRELARKNQCDATCPVSTAIFLRISAEAAIEQMNSGKSASAVAPFWRVVAPDSTIAGKLSIDKRWIALQREAEAQSSNGEGKN